MEANESAEQYTVLTDEQHRIQKTYFIVIDLLLLLPTIVGNLLVLLSLFFFRALRKLNSHILVGNLALADLLVGLVVLPLDLSLLWSPGVSSDVRTCLWFHCINNSFIGASVLNLLIMSIERFHSIVFPLQHEKRFTRRVTVWLIAGGWIFILILGPLPQIFIEEIPKRNYSICRSDVALPLTFSQTFNSIIIAALIITFFLFLAVVKTTVCVLRKTGLPLSANRNAHVKQDLRHTLLMLGLSGMFVLCWGPHCLASAILVHESRYRLLRSWLSSLGLINSALEWIVYGLLNRRFRRAFRSIVKCQITHLDFSSTPPVGIG